MTNYLNESVSMRIEADPSACFQQMKDFESYPLWQKAISTAKILEHHDTEPVVEFVADVLVKKVRYVLRYKIDEEKNRLSWGFIEGDIKFAAGYFEAVELHPGISQASYQLNIDPGFWVPNLIIQAVKKIVMAGVLHDLQKRMLAVGSR